MTDLRRVLTPAHALVIAVGIVIGAGIFRVPSSVAQLTGSPGQMLALWLAGGLLSLLCALTYAELAAMTASTGGDYRFLTRAYGRHVGFMFGWARATVIVTGSIALLGFTLGDYLSTVLSLGAHSAAIYAALAVLLLTALNLAGLRRSVGLQGWVTVLEAGGVLLVAVAGLAAAGAAPAPAPAAGAASSGSGSPGLALVFVLLAYGGWNEAAYLAGELRGGARAIVGVLVGSCLTVTVLYVLFVAGALAALGFDGLRASTAVGVDVMNAAFGPAGGGLVAGLVAIAALSSMNATMIVGARSNHAMACEWTALSAFNGWNGDRSVPAASLLAQAAISLGLIALGAAEKSGFDAMVEFTAPVFWFFLMLAALALPVLRWREPDAARPFSVPLYPWLPLAATATTAYLFYTSVTYAQSQRAVHVSLYLVGTGGVAWLAAWLHQRRTGLA